MSIDINGTNQHTSVPPLTLGDNYTISIWAFPDSTNTSRTIVHQNTATGSASHFEILEATGFPGGFTFRCKSDDATLATVSSSNGTKLLSAWNNIIGRRVGGQISLFVNGVKITDPSSVTFDTFAAGSSFFQGGGVSGADTIFNAFNGKIAENAVWDTNLSDEECIALGKRANVLSIRPGSLLVHTPLYNPISPTPDYSGNSLNITVLNSPSEFDQPPVARFTRQATPFSMGTQPVIITFLRQSELGNKYIVNKAVLNQGELFNKYKVNIPSLELAELNNKYKINPSTLSLGEMSNLYKIEAFKLFQGELGSKYKVNPVVLNLSELSNLYKIESFKLFQGELGQKYKVNPVILSLGELGNKFAVLSFRLSQGELSQKYIVQDSKLEVQLKAIYGLRFVKTIEGIYGTTIARQLLARAGYTIPIQLNSLYQINVPVVIDLDSIYDISNVDTVFQQLQSPYNMSFTTFQLGSPYALAGKIFKQVSSVYALSVVVKKQQDFKYDFKNTDTVTKQLKGVYPILKTQLINITGVPTITIGGQILDVADVDISIDEFSFIWRGNIKILNIEDYVLFNINDEIILNLYGEIFNLIVESKKLSRGAPPLLDMSITAVSPAIKFAFPRAEPLDITFDNSILAETAAEIAIGGEDIDWQMIDWLIPSNRLAIKDGSPIELVQRIVEAGGGVLESKPDGQLLARPQFPVSLNKFDTGTLDQVYLDTQDNLSVSERFSPTKRLNKFRISDIRTGFRDVMDFVFNSTTENDIKVTSTTEGRLRVFPSPFRTNVVVKSSEKVIGFQLVGVSTEDVVEEVEFKEGIGSIGKPIDSIVSVVWKSLDLGSLSFVQGDNKVLSASTVNLYSLATVTYKTRFIEYTVFGQPGFSTQFRLEEVNS